MKLTYNIPLPNNKEIPLIVNCSIFTFLRLQFTRIKLHKCAPFTCNSLFLEEHKNILTIESVGTHDYKNKRYTNKCIQLYVSQDYTDRVVIDISYDGTISALTEYYNRFKQIDDITKSLEERNEVFVSRYRQPDLLYLLKDADKLEIKPSEHNLNEFIIRYKDEYRPELYY